MDWRQDLIERFIQYSTFYSIPTIAGNFFLLQILYPRASSAHCIWVKLRINVIPCLVSLPPPITSIQTVFVQSRIATKGCYGRRWFSNEKILLWKGLGSSTWTSLRWEMLILSWVEEAVDTEYHNGTPWPSSNRVGRRACQKKLLQSGY